MVSEELSQDEIDSLFSGGDSKEEDSVNPVVKEFSNLLNTSIEEVLKTAFSLEVVSKFIDLNVKKKEELTFEEGVFLFLNIGIESEKAPCFIYIKKEFASILSDLMLMGPGEPKDNLEPDDLDAIKELFSQVFGNLQTAFKENNQQELSMEISDVTQESKDIVGEYFYDMEFDIAVPNIKSDSVSLYIEKEKADALFKQIEKEEEQEDEAETEPESVPFENVETDRETTETPPSHPQSQTPSGNLDLIMDVDLDVKIRIGEKNMLIKDILKLKEGSIIELEKNIEEPMEILINDKVVAKGVVVVVGGRFGVKITNIDTKEERIKSLGG